MHEPLTHDEYLAELKAYHEREDARWAAIRAAEAERARPRRRRRRMRSDIGRAYDLNALNPERLDADTDYLPPRCLVTGRVA